ncbi:hypothetical protein PENSOL_c039G10882 [Penicillium solitum]|uniref:Uncharacterized protein n=1 Tax=Penicillium solitum TaxID=60172 RepID=A0A1V6QTZ2_9EURO|nr:uncharacterized protein PENSOL_c039G10882 [Penicillium solitum]OQD92669.1 hypothetical protein PENSOL_c039G10882 [Penicillium solitum]
MPTELKCWYPLARASEHIQVSSISTQGLMKSAHKFSSLQYPGLSDATKKTDNLVDIQDLLFDELQDRFLHNPEL